MLVIPFPPTRYNHWPLPRGKALKIHGQRHANELLILSREKDQHMKPGSQT